MLVELCHELGLGEIAQARMRAIGHWTEGWDGYAAGRQRVLDAIAATAVPNPMFIGGDIHSFWTTDLKADFSNPSSKTIATEFVGTSITSDGPPYQRFLEMLPENPHVRFFDSRQRGHVAVDVTAKGMDTRFQVISDRRDHRARSRRSSASSLKAVDPARCPLEP